MDLLFYCHEGFEKTTLDEVSSLYEIAEAECGTGYVYAKGMITIPDISDLIFARQRIHDVREVLLPPGGEKKVPLIVEKLLEILPDRLYSEIFIEHPDTTDGRSLSGFGEKLLPALGNALKKAGFKQVFSKKPEIHRIHLFFASYEKLYVGRTLLEGASPHQNGIMRLKMPHDAPSRSVLKLEEAVLTMLSPKERAAWLHPTERAIDLGAAPGGWSYFLVKNGLYVLAIDNGPMDSTLMATGMVEHKQEDAFHYVPKAPLGLMVCDIVDQPKKVATLVRKWMDKGYAKRAIFNLKLPMKQKWEEVALCEDILTSGGQFAVRMRHLYHDRDEITVCLFPVL